MSAGTTSKVTVTKNIRDLGEGKRKRWQVRWKVDGAPEKTRAFEGPAPKPRGKETAAQAFQRRLLTAVENGELFDRETCEPVSWAPVKTGPNIAEYTRNFIATHWHSTQPTTRRSDIEEAAAWLPALTTRDIADRKTLYSMLKTALNPSKTMTRAEADLWTRLVKVSMPVASIKRVHMDRALTFCRTNLDGTLSKGTYGNRRRASLAQILIDAVANELLDRNPLENFKEPKSVQATDKVDAGEVGEPQDVMRVFEALAESRYLVLYELMFYAGLRPSEVVVVRWGDFVKLPTAGWGSLLLKRSGAEAGSSYTDTGESRQEGVLKHRRQGEYRVVPLPPVLCARLLEVRPNKARRDAYVCAGWKVGSDGKKQPVSNSTLDQTWKAARDKALPDADERVLYRSYSLRHSAASLWLGAAAPPVEIAKRLGHSVAMLLSTYADVLESHAPLANTRIEESLDPANWDKPDKAA